MFVPHLTYFTFKRGLLKGSRLITNCIGETVLFNRDISIERMPLVIGVPLLLHLHSFERVHIGYKSLFLFLLSWN